MNNLVWGAGGYFKRPDDPSALGAPKGLLCLGEALQLQVQRFHPRCQETSGRHLYRAISQSGVPEMPQSRNPIVCEGPPTQDPHPQLMIPMFEPIFTTTVGTTDSFRRYAAMPRLKSSSWIGMVEFSHTAQMSSYESGTKPYTLDHVVASNNLSICKVATVLCYSSPPICH